MSDLDNQRVWVMGSGHPTDTAGNGLHYKDCYTFEIPPRLATKEELATLRICSKCDRGIDAAPQFAICPVCNMTLPASGICDSGH